MWLMCGDEKVLHFDMASKSFDVLNPGLLPYQLRGALVCPKDGSYESMLECLYANKDALMGYFAGRVLALSRRNAKKVLNVMNLEQARDISSKANVALACRSVSVLDNYWVLNESESRPWASVNIRKVPLNSVVAQVALHGISLTLQSADVDTPELTTAGAYAKCWKRDGGGLWLYKRSESADDYESRVEVCVSNLLDRIGVPHVRYEAASSKGKYCCRCLCMADDNVSIMSGMDYLSYCSRTGADGLKEIHRLDPEMMYRMHIIDYLISNVDRHNGNWGIRYDSRTMAVLGCHQLFDHNNAFDREDMKSVDGMGSKFFRGKSMREVAEYSLKRCSFRLGFRPSVRDFMDRRQYGSFVRRAKILGLL